MDEENKKYSIVGKVEIGTDEYRDLIERSKDAERNYEEYRSKYWSEQSITSDLRKKIDSLTSQKDDMMAFIKSDEMRYKSWLAWLAEKSCETE